MVLKLETFVEIDTKEPSVVKQLLNEKLSSSLKRTQDLLKNYCSSNNKSTRDNSVSLLWELNSTELRKFLLLLWDNNVTVLTPDQVVERLKKGLKG